MADILKKKYDSYSLGTVLLYGSSKFSSDFLYSITPTQDTEGIDLYTRHLYNNQLFEVNQHNRVKRKKLDHVVQVGVDYQPDDKNKIRLSYNTQLTPVNQSIQNSTGSLSNAVNKKNNEKPVQMHHMSLNYYSGFGMDVGVDYTFYQNHMKQDFSEIQTLKEKQFQVISKQDISRVSGYLDQKQVLGSGWQVNYGGKFAIATDRSSQYYKSDTTQDPAHLNSVNQVKEHTYNLYGGFNKNIGEKLSLMGSFTAEYYKHGVFDEWTLFPQIEATYVYSPFSIWQLSISSNKEYPSYWEKQGFIGFLNGYMELHGNPDLKPFKDYSTQLTYLLKSKYSITAFWQFSDGYFAQLPYQSTDKLALIYKTTNFDYKKQWGIISSIPFQFVNILDSRLTLMGFYDQVKHSRFYDLSFKNEQLAFYLQANNSFNISSRPNIKLELNGKYITKSIQGPMTIHPLWSIDTGLKWIFANNQAELNIKGIDLFNTWVSNVTENLENQNLKMNMTPDTKAFMVSFSYKFGGYTSKDKKVVDSSRLGI